MANLDRFSEPLPNEKYFEDEKPVCQCEECGEDLFEGEWHFEAADMTFCELECFVEWCKNEYDGRTQILEGKN